jgi:uncharacterized protein
MSLDMGKRAIDFFLNHVDLSYDRPYSISWWGGEPLIEWDLLKSLMFYAKNELSKRTELKGHDVIFGGTTNGVSLTPSKAKLLKEHKACMTVSVDGIKKVHDLYRVRPNGKGSFDRILHNVVRAVEIWPSIVIRMSLSRVLVPHLLESIAFFYERGVKNFLFSPVYEEEWTDDDFNELRQQYIGVAEFLNRHKDVNCKFFTDSGQDTNVEFPCGAGRHYVGIAIDGEIYPCHRFHKYGPGHEEHNKKWCIGNIWDGFNEKRQIFLDYPKLRRLQCGHCTVYKRCLGGCYATITDLVGNPFQLLPHFCKHMNLLYGEAAHLVEPRPKCNGTEATGCICYNMCYLENTENEIIHFDRSSNISCACYATQYTGPNDESLWRPIAGAKALPEKG